MAGLDTVNEHLIPWEAILSKAPTRIYNVYPGEVRFNIRLVQFVSGPMCVRFNMHAVTHMNATSWSFYNRETCVIGCMFCLPAINDLCQKGVTKIYSDLYACQGKRTLLTHT